MSDVAVDPVSLVTDFSRFLRARGIATTTASSIDATRALDAVDPTDKRDVQLAFRSVFVNRRQDLALFDELFDEWWNPARSLTKDATQKRSRDKNPSVIAQTDEPKHAAGTTALTRWAQSAGEEEEAPVPLAAPSQHDATGAKDFRHYTDDDLGTL